MKNLTDIPRKPKLTEKQIDYCLLHMLRVPELFDYAKQHLKPSDFSATSEMFYALIWDVALVIAERNNGKLPAQLETVLQMELSSRLGDAQRYNLSQKDEEMIIGLFGFICTFDEAKLDSTYYRTLIQDLIVERTVLGRMGSDISKYRDIGRPVDIMGALQNYHQKLQGIMVDASSAGASAFPLDYKPKKLGKFATGLSWFDRFMNGGQAPGEVYVLLGPTGLGKTTSGINITVSTARVWNIAYLAGTIKKPKVSCFFSWEQDLERLRLRFWSYAARIDSTRLEDYTDEKIELTRRGKLEKYEVEMLAEDIKSYGLENVDGEYERLQAASKELNETVKIFDFSGAADNPQIGSGGLDEVVAALKALEKDGYEIGVVVLDYANAAVRKYMAAKGGDPSTMRHYLASFCNDCRFKIALPFNCPVWALNQLNTSANKRAPTADQHHSDASECGNFAENAWFAFVFSTKDKTNNTCQLFCTKERRAKGDLKQAFLKIEGGICAMVDVSSSYVTCSALRQIIPTAVAKSKMSPDEVKDKNVERMEANRPGSSQITNY